jgi:hypothetical protein
MLVKATGSVPIYNKLVDHNQSRLVFYGNSLPEIKRWLHSKATQFLSYEGTVHVYEGRYEKTKNTSSQMYDSMKLRHYTGGGVGKGTIGTPGVSKGVKLGMKATGALQTRYFIALVHSTAVNGTAENVKPNIMHHQKACHYRRS